MQYYRCKCGKAEAWGSMPPYQCSSCKHCGSDLAQAPDLHRDPVPHDFSHVEQVRTDEGPKPLTRCKYCHHTKEEIEHIRFDPWVGDRVEFLSDKQTEKGPSAGQVQYVTVGGGYNVMIQHSDCTEWFNTYEVKVKELIDKSTAEKNDRLWKLE